MRILARLMILAVCGAFGLLLATAMLELPPPATRLSEHVSRHLPASGVDHPVTAVLLNFRGYDTLLEIAVLLLALLGVLVCRDERDGGQRHTISPPPVLPILARLTAPLIVLVAGYLLWAGAHQPGGAFQAGAVLASGLVLLYLSGLLPAWDFPPIFQRLGLVVGFLVFLAVAVAMLVHGRFLQYPAASSGALILLIESCLTVSIGILLAGLFFWLPHEDGEDDA